MKPNEPQGQGGPPNVSLVRLVAKTSGLFARTGGGFGTRLRPDPLREGARRPMWVPGSDSSHLFRLRSITRGEIPLAETVSANHASAKSAIAKTV